MRILRLVFLLAAAACGKGEEAGLTTHGAITAAHIRAMEEMANVLDTIHDRASAEAARPRMEAIGKRVREINAAEDRLPPAGPTERARLDAMLEDAAKALDPRIEQAMARVSGDSEAVVLLANLMMEAALDLDR